MKGNKRGCDDGGRRMVCLMVFGLFFHVTWVQGIDMMEDCVDHEARIPGYSDANLVFNMTSMSLDDWANLHADYSQDLPPRPAVTDYMLVGGTLHEFLELLYNEYERGRFRKPNDLPLLFRVLSHLLRTTGGRWRNDYQSLYTHLLSAGYCCMMAGGSAAEVAAGLLHTVYLQTVPGIPNMKTHCDYRTFIARLFGIETEYIIYEFTAVESVQLTSLEKDVKTIQKIYEYAEPGAQLVAVCDHIQYFGGGTKFVPECEEHKDRLHDCKKFMNTDAFETLVREIAKNHPLNRTFLPLVEKYMERKRWLINEPKTASREYFSKLLEESDLPKLMEPPGVINNNRHALFLPYHDLYYKDPEAYLQYMGDLKQMTGCSCCERKQSICSRWVPCEKEFEPSPGALEAFEKYKIKHPWNK